MLTLMAAWVEQEAGGHRPLAPSTPVALDQTGRDDSWENSAQSLRLDFFWAPTVNETLLEVLDKWKTGRGPTVMVLGAGSTSILESNNSAVRLDEHRRNLTKVRAELENIAQYGGTQVLDHDVIKLLNTRVTGVVGAGGPCGLGQTQWHEARPGPDQ